MLGYGVTKDRKLSEDVIRLIYCYAHLRLCKWNDLDISEAVDYGVLRSVDSGYKVKARIYKEKIDMYLDFYISWED